jgi:hypothetical protein
MTALRAPVFHFWRALTALQMRKIHIRTANNQRDSGISREPVRESAIRFRHPEGELGVWLRARSLRPALS